jgi:F0F1-type ATP synthase membrane subunit b/b'
MKDLLFSQMGFWSVFTLVAIIAVMGYFLYKAIKVSGEQKKQP